MKIKLDENLPARLADVLRDLGHDVLTVFTDKKIRITRQP
jgi:predicted nuclease of predicted toxin-antitoxin system